MRTLIMLFTRDLRVHDNPTLAAAVSHADRVVPMFVFDPRISDAPARSRFLAECLNDLRESLRALGSDLLVRRGDPTVEVFKVARAVGATGVAMTRDVSGYAARRERRIESECARQRMRLALFDGVTIVPPGEVVPAAGGDLYQVFTPYYRAWRAKRWRSTADTPRRILGPPATELPPSVEIPMHSPSSRWVGGEAEARRRFAVWSRQAQSYPDHRDELAGDHTSMMSPYLHFGCISPLSLALSDVPEAYVRQLCWRDFFHQLLAAFPKLAASKFRDSASDVWAEDDQGLQRWKYGDTGVDIVDAAMRQLLTEGWMPNRARMVVASYLTKTLGIDWRPGGQWFMQHLVDADVANNFGNWQWVAGTGTDTKPYRRFSPARQAERFDPDGAYRRRHL